MIAYGSRLLTKPEQKYCVTRKEVLSVFYINKAFILDTDACDTGIGVVLSQIRDDGKEQLIAHGSRLLTTTRKELLSVVYFINQYRPCLLGQSFML